ncbi:recombinase family protein [Nocardia rhamnosiphila]
MKQPASTANLWLSVMGAFADFEGALILEHPREGIAAAKARGGYMGRIPALAANQVGRLRVWAEDGEP